MDRDATPPETTLEEYDRQAREYGWFMGDIIFGMCYEYVRPEQQLLDAGIGSGLASVLFARSGLEVSGFDFSPAMLDVCREKGFARELKRYDILDVPWPYPQQSFDFVISAGVFHFLAGLETVFGEAGRLLLPGGIFAFTALTSTQQPSTDETWVHAIRQGTEIYAHSSAYLAGLAVDHGFLPLKSQRCFVGNDLFQVSVLHYAVPVSKMTQYS